MDGRGLQLSYAIRRARVHNTKMWSSGWGRREHGAVDGIVALM